jgi:hypothetical protein
VSFRDDLTCFRARARIVVYGNVAVGQRAAMLVLTNFVSARPITVFSGDAGRYSPVFILFQSARSDGRR